MYYVINENIKQYRTNYPHTQFVKLVNGLIVLLNHLSPEVDIIKDNADNVGLIHNLHFRVYSQYYFSSDNLNVIKKEDGITRLFEIDEGFLLYPNKCNDNQIETAMKNAFKEIGYK